MLDKLDFWIENEIREILFSKSHRTILREGVFGKYSQWFESSGSEAETPLGHQRLA